jgi:uncharacterized membrane protein YgcG
MPARTISLRRFTALLFGCCFLFAAPVVAKEQRLQQFVSEVHVLPDASITVQETITYQFIGGPWHGIYREIPVEYSGPGGLNYSLFVDVTKVEEDGAALRYEKSRDHEYLKLKIYIPNADNSTHVVSISYSVSDALRFFEDHDEFYWNVTGDQWTLPIQSASAQITLPSSASDIRTNVFTGAYHSTARNAVAVVNGNTIDVRTTEPLGLREGLTVAIAFDKGAVREPTALSTFFLYLRSNWPLGLPIVTFVVMFYLWWTKGRDPRLNPITAQYEPPDKLSPGEVGTLIDNSADMRDITASIVDLAVRGYIVIEEKQQDHLLGLTHTKSYVFHLKKARAEWNDLKPHEQELLDGIFEKGNAGDTVSLDELHNQFYRNLPVIKSKIFGALVEDGYYARRPDSVRSSYIGFGIVAGILLVWAGIWMSEHLGMQALPFIVAGLLCAAIICAFGWFMPAHTQTGARAVEGILGFEDFLKHVEADRFNRMIKTPEMFEKFLPFAMALGVEKNWSKAFQGIYTQPPQWYQGGSYGPSFYPYMFVSNLNTMSTQAGSVMASAPRSSMGSGFGGGSGGGGFSGGGFGGGGGGGF